MLRLNLKSEPFWIDLARGVRVQCLPPSSSMMEPVREELFGNIDPEDAAEGASVQFLDWAKVMARHGIVAWEGVGDENGDEVAPSPEYIDALLEDDQCFTAFRDAYVLPTLKVVEEGNA